MSDNKSLVEVAVELMKSKRGAKKLSEIVKEVATIKGFSLDEFNLRVGAFLTDLAASGKFVYLGNNIWDLKERQPFKMSEYDFAITGEIEALPVSKDKEVKEKQDEFDYPDSEYEDDYSDGNITE